MRLHQLPPSRTVDVAPPTRRILCLCVFLAVGVVAVIGKLLYLQLWRHDFLSGYAREQQTGEAPNYGQRGMVLDRAGRELARSLWAESFYAEPRRIADVPHTARQLAPLLKEPVAELQAELQKAKDAKRGFMWLARRVDQDTAQAVRALKLAGIASRPEQRRIYRNGPLAAHLLGFVGLDGDGLAGIERASNKQLQGTPGEIKTEQDGRGTVYERWETEPQDGRSLVLTVDTAIQYRTEQIMAAAVSRTRAKSGMAVVMEPRTGAILALANVPTFDPNKGYTPADKEAARNPAKARAEQLRYVNQAVQLVYEPGSTFKVVAYAGALEEGLTNPSERMRCGGVTRIGGIEIQDKNAGGILPLADALAKSSNTAAITLGRRLGENRMYDYIKRFGFGARTGVELTGESRGILRDVKNWQGSSIGSISIGQEISITPLQLAAAFSAIANDGIYIKPHLIQEIRDAQGVTLAEAHPATRRVVSPQTAATMRKMLEGVTLRGTAKLARLGNGYTVAGKTGTAQKYDPALKTYSKTKHIASFVGMTPANKPDVVIAIVIDEPVGADHGGEVAAPIFRELAEQILPLVKMSAGATEPDPTPVPQIEVKRTDSLPVAPEDSAAGVQTRPQAAGNGRVVRAPGTKNGFVLPDLRGKSLAEVGQLCTQLGLEAELRGHGRAASQTPAAGTEVNVGSKVTIEFSSVERD